MKISALEIKKYRHLENLHFDFTYKSGSKKGQPLDKICLIGQSATGKTSILDLLSNIIGKSEFEQIEINKEFKNNEVIVTLNINGEYFELNKKNEEITQIRNEYNIDIIPNLSKLHYFTSQVLNNKVLDLIDGQELNKNFNSISEKLNIIKNSNIIKEYYNEFSEDINEGLWDYLLKDILDYRAKLLQKGSELINKGLHTDFIMLEKEMIEWKKENINPLIEIAKKCLNPLLKKLNLEVDLVDTSALLVLKPISKDYIVPTNGLSTGTKQILLTAYPIFKLPAENAIILIDEPERSLYPDMQIDLIDYYKNIAPRAQFIIATHSPFIAAAFEPEERFILSFDRTGSVKVTQGKSPIGDDPNDLLSNDFGINPITNKAGQDAWENYLQLKKELILEKNNEKKKIILDKVETLGELYNYPE